MMRSAFCSKLELSRLSMPDFIAILDRKYDLKSVSSNLSALFLDLPASG